MIPRCMYTGSEEPEEGFISDIQAMGQRPNREASAIASGGSVESAIQPPLDALDLYKKFKGYNN